MIIDLSQIRMVNRRLKSLELKDMLERVRDGEDAAVVLVDVVIRLADLVEQYRRHNQR